jgi:hypothetical protein
MLVRPLISNDVAEAAIFMLSQPLNNSVKALDIVPSGMYPDIECKVLDLIVAQRNAHSQCLTVLGTNATERSNEAFSSTQPKNPCVTPSSEAFLME